jgi:hypothetical protein
VKGYFENKFMLFFGRSIIQIVDMCLLDRARQNFNPCNRSGAKKFEIGDISETLETVKRSICS